MTIDVFKNKKKAWIISTLIPLIILGYIIYMNWLPFGYEKTFVLDVGSEGDTDISQKLYLAKSGALSSPKTYQNKTFRTLTGTTELIFKPKARVKNVIINISLEGENIFVVPPKNDFNFPDYDWNLSIDFSEGTPEFLEVDANFSSLYQQQYVHYLQKERNISIDFSQGIPLFLEMSTNFSSLYQQQYTYYRQKAKNISIDFSAKIPEFLKGNASIRNSCAYFNGSVNLLFPGTEDEFETESFAVYVEWTPEDKISNSQQIVGHYNWELFQNNNSILFQVGRMNNATGKFYSISYPIDTDFFDIKHSALVVYMPNENRDGALELFIDKKFISRKNIGTDIILADYSKYPLSFGKSKHKNANYFKGCIHKFEVANKNLSNFYINKIKSELIFNNLILTNKDGAYFSGQNMLYYPNTENLFEAESFAIYVEWTPEDNSLDFQQIIGHYNWELIQNNNSIIFQVGRMNNASGKFYAIKHKIKDDFFNKKHSALLIYFANEDRRNFIELFVDNKFIEKKNIASDVIWVDYSDYPFSFGKSMHDAANYFKGYIHKVELINKNLSSFHMKKAESKLIINNPISTNKDCAYFDGQTSLHYPNTEDQFEKGPFAVYVEWTPENNISNFQQIIGHYNWELLQNNNSIFFQVGRMNDKTNRFDLIDYKIKNDFFNQPHSALALYVPKKYEGGYIALFVDGKFAGMRDIKDYKIWDDYGVQPLSLGKSEHDSATYYVGCVHKVAFIEKNINLLKNYVSFSSNIMNSNTYITGNGELKLINFHVKKNKGRQQTAAKK